MASNIFDKLELAAFKAGITPRTKESREWFRVKAQAMGRNINRTKLMKEEPLERRSRTVMGRMYMFFYDPKLRETLPYYDAFPLVIVVRPAPGGFYGLNLHYLPPILRAKLLDGLMEIADTKKGEDSKFRLTYKLLNGTSKLKWFRPCFKHYLTSHVQSKFAEVQPPEWEIATFLPTAQFRKAKKGEIYKDSRDIIRNA